MRPGGVAEAGLTVSVTSIVFGDPETPAAVTVTLPEYVPGASPAIAAATDKVAGALPLAGVTLSQAASSDVVKLSVPPPVLVTATVCAAGSAPPAVAVKLRPAAPPASTGGGGATTKVTGMLFGEPVAPVAVTVTLAV